MADTLARVGQHGQAFTVAASIIDSEQRADALALVAGQLVQVGQYEQGVVVASSIVDLPRRGRALGSGKC